MTRLFRKVLCPIDFSEHSLAALDVALKIAQQNDAALYLLNVAPMPAGAAGFQPVQWIRYPIASRRTGASKWKSSRSNGFLPRCAAKRS